MSATPRPRTPAAAGSLVGTPIPAAEILVALALAIVGCGLGSLALGQDANWDLRNYHFYNPWAWLHGRATLDLAAAQIQSYFNPLVDLVPYALIRSFAPRTAGFLLGALHGLNGLLLYLVARRALSPRLGLAARRSLAAVCTLAGVAGPLFVVELRHDLRRLDHVDPDPRGTPAAGAHGAA